MTTAPPHLPSTVARYCGPYVSGGLPEVPGEALLLVTSGCEAWCEFRRLTSGEGSKIFKSGVNRGNRYTESCAMRRV